MFNIGGTMLRNIFLGMLLFALIGCGPRQKALLNKMVIGMTKSEVKAKIGAPDETCSPRIEDNGDVVDIWKYELATIDNNQWNKRFGVAFGCALLCPLLGFIPLACMDSEYSYDMYFLKFVNQYLRQWGNMRDIGFRNL